MSEILISAAEKASRKRDWMVSQAKATRPTAAFYIGLIAISQEIDRAANVAMENRDEVKSAVMRIKSVSDDIDGRYRAEKKDDARDRRDPK